MIPLAGPRRGPARRRAPHRRPPWPAVWLLLAAIAGCTPPTAEPGSEETPRSIAALEAAIAGVLSETGTPGVGYVLVDREGIRHAGGVGLADRASGGAMDTGTILRWGSISKSIVAVAVLQLREQGRIRLEDRVRELIPEIEHVNRWEATHPVRVVHLLEHTSGFDDIHLVEFGHRDAGITLRQGLDFHPHSRTSRWPPGTHFSYSNSGPPMAAYAIEKLTGQSFESYAEEHVLRPLGIVRGSFLYTPEVQRGLATSYRRDGRTPMPYAHLIIRPSGSFSATPAEMGAFVRMLLNRGSVDGIRVLEPASVERMESPASALYARSGVAAGYALGNFAAPRDGFLWRGHTGGIDGFLARYGYLPEHGVGYAYAINAENAQAFDRIGALIRAHLAHDLEPPPAAPTVEVPGELERLAGLYVLAASRNQLTRFLDRLVDVIHVRPRGDRLVARKAFGQEVELIPLGGGRFRTADDPIATLVFVEEEGERLMQGYTRSLWGSYRRASAPLQLLLWSAAAISLALMASALLGALLWLPRAMLARGRGLGGGAGARVLALPALAAALLAGAVLLVLLASSDLLVRLGTPTVYSVGFAILTVLFAIAALAGAVQVARSRPAEAGRGAWWYAALVSAANCTSARTASSVSASGRSELARSASGTGGYHLGDRSDRGGAALQRESDQSEGRFRIGRILLALAAGGAAVLGAGVMILTRPFAEAPWEEAPPNPGSIYGNDGNGAGTRPRSP
jgi:CubicO group peptidase (beta-lactamase class C family)